MISLSEMFYSIQGESYYTGLPCVFVRLSGCNLECTYCDTKYSYNEDGRAVSLSTITGFVEEHKNAVVEITGGEPLLQENVYILLDELLRMNRKILLETNGSISIERIPEEVYTIIDVKCPGSSFETSFLFENLKHLENRIKTGHHSAEIKFVLCDQKDYLWAKQFILDHKLAQTAPITFSPVASSLEPRKLAEMILTDELPVRLQIQFHTILWPDKKRGV